MAAMHGITGKEAKRIQFGEYSYLESIINRNRTCSVPIKQLSQGPRVAELNSSHNASHQNLEEGSCLLEDIEELSDVGRFYRFGSLAARHQLLRTIPYNVVNLTLLLLSMATLSRVKNRASFSGAFAKVLFGFKSQTDPFSSISCSTTV